MKRSAGILLPIFSLPSNYGIGTLGKEAYEFVDFLKQSKQAYWQILPIGITGFGDSPYASFSIYAGNPYFIDLDLLVKDKLLTNDDLKDIKVKNLTKVDYGYLFNTRYQILYKAYLKGIKKYANEFERFKEETFWLYDFSFFMSLKKYFNNASWLNWDDDIRFRNIEALNRYGELLKDDIEFYSFIEFLFFKQFNNLKKYANSKGIKIIGDIPIYVQLDSAECWSNPECFKLDEDLKPTEVSGVPPDYFAKDGQLWGNPLYDYDYMRNNGYKLWIDRIGAASKIYDVIRIDHFRGFESYWAVKYGEKTARNGHWIKGPGMDLLDRLKGWFKDVEFIVEDLGNEAKDVEKLVEDFGFPNMKVLEFGFDYKKPSGHAPFMHYKNMVCYVGTHDNQTALGYLKSLKKKDLDYMKKYLDKDEIDNWTLIKVGMNSNADLFICQLQDYLCIDDKGRINIPGKASGNWSWRFKKDDINKELIDKIVDVTKTYHRISK